MDDNLHGFEGISMKLREAFSTHLRRNSGRFVRRLRSVLVRGRHEETRVLHWIPFFAPNFLLNCHRLFEAASTVSAPIASTPKQNHQQRQEEKKTTWMRSGDKKTVGGKTTVYS